MKIKITLLIERICHEFTIICGRKYAKRIAERFIFKRFNSSCWKCWVFVVLMTLGVAALTVAGISGSVIESVIGGVVIILDIIFGVMVVKTAKKS